MAGFFQSAFEKLAAQQQDRIAQATEYTALQVSPQGDLFGIFVEMRDYLKAIALKKDGSGGGTKIDTKGAKVLGKALPGIGKGIKLIAEAINAIPDSKAANEKMEAIARGVDSLQKLGGAILLFAVSLVLATPLLIFGIPGLILSMGMIFLVGLVFQQLDKMGIEKSIAKISTGLMLAGAAFVTLAASFLLVELILSNSGNPVGTVILTLLMVGAVGGLFKLFDTWDIEKALTKISLGLMLASLAIVVLAGGFMLAEMMLSEVSDPFKNILIIGALIMGVAFSFKLVGKFAVDIAKGSLALIVAGIGLAVLGFGVSQMVKDIPDFKTAMGLIGLIGALAAVIALVGAYEAGMLTGVPLTITMGSIALTAAGVALAVLGLGLLPMMHAVSELSLEQAGMIALVIGGVSVVFAAAGVGGTLIFLGAAALTVAGVALASIGVGLLPMIYAVQDLTLEQAEMIALVITGLGASMALMGPMSPLILLGAAAMIPAGLATAAIAGGLAALTAVNFDKLGSIKERGTLPFNDSGEKGWFGGKKTNFEVAMGAIADGLAINPLTIFAMTTGAGALTLAGGALVMISKGLRTFQEIVGEIDLDTLTPNIKLVTETLADAFGYIGDQYPGGGQSFIGALFGSTVGRSKVHMGISAVRGMGDAMAGIAMGVQHMANLRFPTKWDKDGNPIEFRQLTEDDFKAVGANTKEIITALSGTFASIGEEDAASGGWFSKSAYEKGFNVASGMGTALANLAGGVKGMAELKFPVKYDKDGNVTEWKSITEEDMTLVGENTKALVLALSGTFSEIGGSEAAKGDTWFTTSAYTKGVELVSGFSEPLAKIASFVKDFTAQNIGDDQIEDMNRKTKNIVMGIAKGFMFDDDGVQINVDDLENAAAAYGDMVKSHGKITSSFGDMTESINDLDLEKLTEVRMMYEALANASNAEFNIVEEMGQSMLDAINLLAEKLAEFAGNVSAGANAGGGATEAGGAPAAPSGTPSKGGQQQNGAGQKENKDLAKAIKNLERVLSGTLPVYVTNQGV